MLDLIRDILRDLGLLASGTDTRFSVDLTTGNNFLVNVYTGRDSFFHIRAAESSDLSPEFDIAVRVHQSLGRFVPRPIAHVRRDRFNCIVFEGIDLAQISDSRAFKCSSSERLGQEIEQFFGLTSERQTVKDGSVPFLEEMERLTQRFAGTDHGELLARALMLVDSSPLRLLPGISQHGDMVLNNLGLSGSNLVVYDWEDFGKSSLRGFDLGVLLASVCRFDPAILVGLRQSGMRGSSGRKVGWLGPSCRALGLELDDFWAAMPLYLVLFLKLKDPYSDHIRSMVARAIVGIL